MRVSASFRANRRLFGWHESCQPVPLEMHLKKLLRALFACSLLMVPAIAVAQGVKTAGPTNRFNESARPPLE